MARISLLMLVPPVVFLGLAGVFLWGMNRNNPDEIPSAFVGQMAPSLQITQLGPNPPFTDATLRDGKVKIVNFWASWCGPCRVEHPNLVKLAAEGVPIYGINYRDKPEDALGFLAEMGDPFTALGADARARTGLDWGVTAVPESFVLDGQGKVILRFAGPMVQRVIDADIRPALAKAAGN